MKTSITARVATIVGLTVGAFALSALAQSVWNPAPANPPSNNVAAPLNVSNSSQEKTGGTVTLDGNLGVAGNTVVQNLQILAGNPGLGKVLTSNASGSVSWQAPGVAPSIGNVTLEDGCNNTVTTLNLSLDAYPANCAQPEANDWGNFTVTPYGNQIIITSNCYNYSCSSTYQVGKIVLPSGVTVSGTPFSFNYNGNLTIFGVGDQLIFYSPGSLPNPVPSGYITLSGAQANGSLQFTGQQDGGMILSHNNYLYSIITTGTGNSPGVESGGTLVFTQD